MFLRRLRRFIRETKTNYHSCTKIAHNPRGLLTMEERKLASSPTSDRGHEHTRFVNNGTSIIFTVPSSAKPSCQDGVVRVM